MPLKIWGRMGSFLVFLFARIRNYRNVPCVPKFQLGFLRRYLLSAFGNRFRYIGGSTEARNGRRYREVSTRQFLRRSDRRSGVRGQKNRRSRFPLFVLATVLYCSCRRR